MSSRPVLKNSITAKKLLQWSIPLLAVLGVGGLLWALFLRPPAPQVQSQVIVMADEAPLSDAAFTRVEGPRPFVFPRDHGPHPDYQTEWWYYTGNLEGSEGQRFGYQLTFFRRAGQPAAARADRPSPWAADQIYMAHFTLTDTAAEQFHYSERFERGAAGLAGALPDEEDSDARFEVWLHDWSVRQVADDEYLLRVQDGDVSLDLRLTDRKGPVFQGDQGYSRKGPEPGNASLYYSFTRLESEGTISIEGRTYPVNGLSWMDREISTSALSQGQVGWDWFALQLDDGSELMVYVIRRSDGSVDRFSSGLFVFPDGTSRVLSSQDYQISVEDRWRSPHSRGEYPARWHIRVPSLGLDLQVQPQLADQELNVTVIYWEGSVAVSGTREGQLVRGYGYVELTGYAQSLEGQL
jgi:predicted secreted hydrolase